MTMVYGIQEENFFSFIKRINEFNRTHNVIATQTHFDSPNKTWYAIVYFGDSQESGKAKFETMQGTRTKPPFSPASNLATEKQINFLKKEGVKIKENLTKQEAKNMISDYINNLKRKNI